MKMKQKNDDKKISNGMYTLSALGKASETLDQQAESLPRRPSASWLLSPASRRLVLFTVSVVAIVLLRPKPRLRHAASLECEQGAGGRRVRLAAARSEEPAMQVQSHADAPPSTKMVWLPRKFHRRRRSCTTLRPSTATHPSASPSRATPISCSAPASENRARVDQRPHPTNRSRRRTIRDAATGIPPCSCSTYPRLRSPSRSTNSASATTAT
jgi:hypothetical protein